MQRHVKQHEALGADYRVAVVTALSALSSKALHPSPLDTDTTLTPTHYQSRQSRKRRARIDSPSSAHRNTSPPPSKPRLEHGGPAERDSALGPDVMKRLRALVKDFPSASDCSGRSGNAGGGYKRTPPASLLEAHALVSDSIGCRVLQRR